MSYSRFKKACIRKDPDFMRTEDGASITSEVRDEWLHQGMLNGLVSYATSNYDTVSSKPTGFIVPIREKLVNDNETELLIKLFKKLIMVHTEDLWLYLPQLTNVGGTLNSEQLEDRRQRVNAAQAGCLTLLAHYVHDLNALSYSDVVYLEQLDNLIAHIKLLKKPRPKIIV
ncbi:hypothetical protein FLM48_15270 [Shewanella sp. Scap07]|uniref:hypothetical protein n=1 Tax=Shewanella sp. Scap07 TaxID=2589987 RepID=UPI0015C030BF|nr:hypothetical protein [Shewanella sp. Scap07]QLE86313.1 hypothetical protein FLM48_15270 [Shewanella sp. Scap07]